MRIIAGNYRGRPIQCPPVVTRPTLDRVREALFSILGDLTDQSVVDLYAGSGALGFEALSRGARHAVLVEADRGACAVIRANAAYLGCQGSCRVVEAQAENARRSLNAAAPFDLVLSDPPWAIAQEALGVVLKAVHGLLAPEARIVVGHAKPDRLVLPDDGRWEVEQDRSWGGSALLFVRARSLTP
jgi:16S rRNA (guanine966-N2)-methyltransferase